MGYEAPRSWKQTDEPASARSATWPRSLCDTYVTTHVRNGAYIGRRGKGAMEHADDETPHRGRGRPSRLSREQIIVAAAELVAREPGTSLTIKRVAEAVGAAPMALYRYFPDRDDLLQ